MKEKGKLADCKFLLWSFLLLLPIMFVLPFYSIDTYSIVKKKYYKPFGGTEHN